MMREQKAFTRCAVALLLTATVAHCELPRPDHTQHAEMARWLVHINDWGTLSTISRDLSAPSKPVPYGSTVSFSDGPLNRSTGRLLFYLTLLDAAAYDLQAEKVATLAVAEAQVYGSCGVTDPEDPTCAKVSITGEVAPVPKAQLREAEDLMFQRHPAMRQWPKDHGFQLYELVISSVRLLDFYGGAADISPKAYYDVQFDDLDSKPQLATI
eukprot:CAMPEP_0206141792 /NCGR_PEP_ID=MMETSP1473-20131121/14135_1 /ASSEMBLY_ACC=CAM_ASM_001109 /TAXON_ID=1461547 /ORGANISM="Stichococcus sp, Strain RCC1054" /LENGTH=211 /DNA_ID=CAMNT_0053536487 /DNA_START=99 /DNA_END=734 /DNA_ORIENTATION=+